MISKVYNKAVCVYVFIFRSSFGGKCWVLIRIIFRAYVLQVMYLCLWTLRCVLAGQQKNAKDNIFSKIVYLVNNISINLSKIKFMCQTLIWFNLLFLLRLKNSHNYGNSDMYSECDAFSVKLGKRGDTLKTFGLSAM